MQDGGADHCHKDEGTGGVGLTFPPGWGSLSPSRMGVTPPAEWGSLPQRDGAHSPAGWGSLSPSGMGVTLPAGWGSLSPAGWGSLSPAGWGSPSQRDGGHSLQRDGGSLPQRDGGHSLPHMGMSLLSAFITTEDIVMVTGMASKYEECGARVRMAASVGGACRPFTTTWWKPPASHMVRMMALSSKSTTLQQKRGRRGQRLGPMPRQGTTDPRRRPHPS